MNFIPFNSRNELYKSPFGAASDTSSIMLRILLHDDAKCSAAFLKLREDSGKEKFIQLSASDYYDANFRWYLVNLTLPEGIYWYSFCFDSPWGRQFITRQKGGEGHITPNGSEWQLTVYESSYDTPLNYAGGIIYQIFPDRFYGSGSIKENVPADRYIQSNRQATPEYRQNNGLCSLGNDYFGGDLNGIAQKLPYLAELGVSIIYLNPIFEAHSNHRYNTADYMKIDPMLGKEKDLENLCRKAEEFNISIILDGVFSHTGDDSRYFNRHSRYDSVGAYNSKESKYYNWYNFNSWPDKYSAWWGVPSLPETNEENESFCDFITGENGVLRYWMKQGVKGWRLDVADELPDKILDKIRTAVKQEDKDAIIIGEVWEDATNKISYGHRRRYLRGRQLDSVMNYPFSIAIIQFLKHGNAEQLCETCLSICENYPKPALHLLMNHIGTHDTERVLTALGGEEVSGRNREWQSQTKMTNEQIEKAKKLLYIAALLQYTLPGIPSLYYGDESGMEGYGDPFCRACYPWGKEDMYLVEFYKKLGRFRRSCQAFVDGEFTPLAVGHDYFAFTRSNDKEQVLICVNRSYNQQLIEIGNGWEESEIIFGFLPQNGAVKVDPTGFTVLRKRTPSH